MAACEHFLAKLRDATKSMDADVKGGWQPFELRGTFLGRGNHVGDGPLDLYGAVQRRSHVVPLDSSEPVTYEQVHVQIRDLSRRLEAENYRFEGSGNTFEQALEAAFVDLCKKYPGGTLSILAEGFEPEGKAATGKTVGFELDTGTAWKDVKAKVFDPAVNIAVNIAGAIAAIFAPEIALPLLFLYNEAQNVDQLVDEVDSGNFTLKSAGLHLAQLGLDLLPMAGQAPIFRTSKAVFGMFHVAGLSGQVLLMKAQVEQQIAQLRDGMVKDAAKLFTEYVDLEKSTDASDPRRAKMKAELDQRSETIRQAALDAWSDALKNFAVVAVPAHLAGAVHEQIRIGRVAELETSGRFVHVDGVDPHYDPRRGQIVGDQSRMDPTAIRRLTGEQDAHMRELGARLADRLGVDPGRIVLKPGDHNQIWRDGDTIQVRYAASTEPEQALAGWERSAQEQKLGTPGRSQDHDGEAAHQSVQDPTGHPGDGLHDSRGDGRSVESHDRIPTAMRPTDSQPRDKIVGIENHGRPYEDPRHDPKLPHEHLDRRELRPYKKMNALTSWKDVEAAFRKGEASVAIGTKVKSEAEGHAILQRLATGDARALEAIGVKNVPVAMDSSLREWALVQGRDGFAIYAGKYASVALPNDVRVLAHNHPGPHPGELAEGRTVKDLPNVENGRDYGDILADLDAAKDAAIVPSIADIHAISDGGDHVIYTRYVNKGHGKIANPTRGTAEPRVSLHLADTKVLRWNERTREYWYEVSMIVKDSTGQRLWSGKIFGQWYAFAEMGTVHATKPPVLERPLPAGWSAP